MNSLPKRQVANTETLPMADLGQSSHLDKELVTKIAENLKARQNKNKETFSKHKRVYVHVWSVFL